ncbi:10718_t:CDS:2 [Funneliformis mosseae]|uniref:10718_t:CDS:1 n=1 Tax=Funneliformis mosseae TaxID=27381 RepID=A0A9N9D271_FUNMO|nr:10718_t:CDS:2 [Funneliformis mosseae]
MSLMPEYDLSFRQSILNAEEKETAHSEFDFSDVLTLAEVKKIQTESGYYKLEIVYQCYLMQKLEHFVSKHPEIELKFSILEIKVTEKEDDWVQNTSIAQLCQFLETLLQSNVDRKEVTGILTTCHHIQFIKAVCIEDFTNNSDIHFFQSSVFPLKEAGSHYLTHFLMANPELLGFSLPTITYKNITLEATKILGIGATSTAYLLNTNYVLKVYRPTYSKQAHVKRDILQCLEAGGIYHIPHFMECEKTVKTNAEYILLSGVGLSIDETDNSVNQQIFTELLDILKQTHNLGIAHRDIQTTYQGTIKTASNNVLKQLGYGWEKFASQKMQNRLYNMDTEEFGLIKEFWNNELNTPHWIKCCEAADNEDYDKLKLLFNYI